MVKPINDNMKPVTLSGGKVVRLRELTWKKYLWAIRRITSTVIPLLAGKDGSVNLADLGKVTIDPEKIVAALSEQEETVTVVLKDSAPEDLTDEVIENLSGRDTMLLLAVVVELNLSPEVLGAGKELAGRMAAVFGSMTASQGPAISSSPTGTASPK